jgi:hypothetical protein
MWSNEPSPRTLSFSGYPLLVASFVVMIAGCPDGKKTYPVKGKFVWPDGSSAKELAGSGVAFQCPEQQVSSHGTIDEEGCFVLRYDKPGDGTVAGKHRILILLGVDDGGRKMQIVHPRYENYKTSGLEVTVEPTTNEFVLKVEPGAWMKRKKS